jgi:hypothetical protein
VERRATRSFAVAALLVAALLAREAVGQEELDVSMRVVDDPSTVVAALIVIDLPPASPDRGAANDARDAASPDAARNPTAAEAEVAAPAERPSERADGEERPDPDGE